MFRKVTAVLVLLVLVSVNFRVFAAEDDNILFKNELYTFAAHTIRPTSQAMAGEFAQVSGMSDEEMQKELNEYLASFYSSNYEKMRMYKTPTLVLTFKLAVIESRDYISILMNCHFPTFYNDGHEEIMSLVVSKSEYKWYKSVEEFLGNNAYNIAGEQVKREILANPAGYYREGKAFITVDPTTAFYIKADNNLAVIYGTNQLGDASLGTPIFELKGCEPFILPQSEIINGLMPLRYVSEKMGYTVGWENGNFTISLGGIYFEWPIGEEFKGIASAEIHNGRTYISPDFFKQILKLNCEKIGEGYKIGR